MEIKDIAALITAIATLIAAIVALISAFTTLIKETKKRKKVVNVTIVLAGIFAIVTVFAVIFVGATIWPFGRSCSNQPKYGFEGEYIEWAPEVKGDSQGITVVEQSADQVNSCKYSLKMIADLEGGHSTRSKGEAYVEIDPHQNLENKSITVWVYVPEGAVGDPNKPNGIQVFVKDKDWLGEYGIWWDITKVRANKWQQVKLTPSKSPPSGVFVDSEKFDPTQIRAVGVKVAIGDGSTATYKGPIYIDDIDW